VSPSESELRAALREGEGEGVDVDAQIRHALRSRRDRRRTFAAIGGAVAAVLAVGGVVTAVQVGRDESPRAVPPVGAPTRAAGSTPVAPVPAACPARPPDPFSLRAFAAGHLFPDHVTAMRVCVYGTGPLTESALLGAPTAQYWTRRFNALRPAGGPMPCPGPPPHSSRQWLVMLPVTHDSPARPVVGTIGFGNCGMTTNGLTTRFAWTLLDDLVASLSSPTHAPPSGGPHTPTPSPS
jgi:hypothetical protein